MERCGRGHHKRRNKGARHALFRQKNHERRRQKANRENRSSLANKQQEMQSSVTLTLTAVKDSMTRVSLPAENWLAFSAGDSVLQWSRMEIDQSGVRQPTLSLILLHDLSWSVHIYGKKVPATCKLTAEFSSTISSPTIISSLLRCIHHAAICPGNSDERFVTLCEKRGGAMKKEGDVIAYLDDSPSSH